MPELERNEPPYLQIARRIRADIESGVLVEGDAVPSAREITSTWGVALATATKVHARLRSEGLVRAVPGVGTVVASGQTTFGGSQRLSASGHGKIYGVDERAEIRASGIVLAPAIPAEALGVEPGSQVVRRERLTYRSGVPISMSVSWFRGESAQVAPKLLSTERLPGGTFAYLAQARGLLVTSGREQVEVGRADASEAEALQIDQGDPVLRSRTWFYADSGEVIEYGEASHPSGQRLSHDFTLI